MTQIDLARRTIEVCAATMTVARVVVAEQALNRATLPEVQERITKWADDGSWRRNYHREAVELAAQHHGAADLPRLETPSINIADAAETGLAWFLGQSPGPTPAHVRPDGEADWYRCAIEASEKEDDQAEAGQQLTGAPLVLDPKHKTLDFCNPEGYMIFSYTQSSPSRSPTPDPAPDQPPTQLQTNHRWQTHPPRATPKPHRENTAQQGPAAALPARKDIRA